MSWDWEKLRQQQQRRGGSGGGGLPPEFYDFFQKLKRFKMPGGLPAIPVIIAAVVILLAGATSVYTVNIDEVGVVQRFGEYVRTTPPGLNFKLPIGIESVTKVRTKHVFKEEFGFTAPPVAETERARTRFAPVDQDAAAALMLTGDLNVALVPWIVQYRIDDPFQYLFKVQDPKKLIIDMSEAAMRLVVGDRSVSEVITERRVLALAAKDVLQRELDMAASGIEVVTIEMKRTNVPEPVQPSFNEVNQAVQEREQLIYQAREEFNRAVPAARGEAERVIRVAEGYAIDRINRAEGDALRFISQQEAYAKAQDVTRKRLYLEMMNEVFPRLGQKYIIDGNQGNVLPLLNLGAQNIITQRALEPETQRGATR